MERAGDILERMRAMERTSDRLPLTPREGRERICATREIERQIGRALWRAERESRKVPLEVRRLDYFVMARRRQIAYEISRWALSVGASTELANELAEQAATRFPRDGVIVLSDRPTSRGRNPRALGTNPRARGISPRQRGTSPRQLRERDREDD